MKKIYLIIAMALPLSLFAQSKFNVEVSGSSLLIKSDGGYGFSIGIGYQVSDRINLILGFMNVSINSDLIDDDYNVNKYYFNVDYRFSPVDSKFGIAAIMGFSYMDFDDKLNLDDGIGFGADLGVRAFHSLDEHFETGINLISTYNSESPGAVLESGLYMKYKF